MRADARLRARALTTMCYRGYGWRMQQTAQRPLGGLIIPYYRVSTARQGRSGLGLEAQRAAVNEAVQREGGTLLPEHVEIETGTSKRTRPVLAAALDQCRLTGATLVIAKLDRLARNVHFVSGLMEAGVEFVALDLPQANRFTIHILAAVAEQEARMISERTRGALKAAKARGVQLGNPNGAAALRRAGKGNAAACTAVRNAAERHAASVAQVVRELAPGRSDRALAAELNARHVRTPRGGQWHAASVARLRARIGLAGANAGGGVDRGEPLLDCERPPGVGGVPPAEFPAKLSPISGS